MTSTHARTLAQALQSRRTALSLALLDTAQMITRFAQEISVSDDQGAALAAREHLCLIDYLSYWIDREDEAFRALYIGERAKMAYEPDHDSATRNAAIADLIRNDARLVSDGLADLSDTLGQDIRAYFEDMLDCIPGPSAQEVRVLFVGDCLHLDITGFVTDQLGRHDISIRPHFITDKNPAGIVQAIRKTGAEAFDVIFYSPFTYENGLSVESLFRLRNAAMSADKRAATVATMIAEMTTVSEALAKTFAVPIFVHNTALVKRHSATARDRLALTASRKLRHAVRHEIDTGVDAMIDALNAATFPHLHKLDELKYLKTHAEADLGLYLYRHGLQHPARLGVHLATDYAHVIETTARLLKKKMVVCDLDNTLWEGVIGEGKVAHYTEKQALLKRLKAKGVVLSIASKNDPANVHWDGGVLRADDFVFSHISWAPKVSAFGDMEKALNLKHKDFVFIDDRADERMMATQAYPHMQALDAQSERTWAMFALWEQMLDADVDMDRTQMYLDRAKRQAFEAAQNTDTQDKSKLFSRLGLALLIREIDKASLKRGIELVNRTNQFNMTGARVTFPQMTDWSASARHKVYVASMSDTFGDMGIIALLVAETIDDAVHIPVFVLSCRVFGYDAEQALLNVVKAHARASGASRVTGNHVQTLVNGPCRETYKDNGFEAADGQWVWTLTDAPLEDPDWLSITIA